MRCCDSSRADRQSRRGYGKRTSDLIVRIGSSTNLDAFFSSEENIRLPPPHTASTPQILSDVDDTFMCSGAGWKGGSDRRFQPHVVYPGAPEFYLALSRGKKNSTDPEGVIWMSARAAHTPIIKLFAGEINDRHPIGQALVAVGRRTGCLSFGTKGGLYGKFRHNIRFSRTSRNTLKGEHKFHNFVNYMTATPFVLPKTSTQAFGHRDEAPGSTMSRSTSGIALSEMLKNDRRGGFRRFWSCDDCDCQTGLESEAPTGPYIFLGDNGEGDETTAIRLLEEHADRVAACFIQDVTGQGCGNNDKAVRLMRHGKLFYFTTFLGAGVQAFQAGLISRESLARVYGAIVQSPYMLSAREITANEEHTAKAARVKTTTTMTGESSSEMTSHKPFFLSPQRDRSSRVHSGMKAEAKPTDISLDISVVKNSHLGRDFGQWCTQIRRDLALYEGLRRGGLFW